MQQDIGAAKTYEDAKRLVASIRAPGREAITDGVDLDVGPDGYTAWFGAVICESIDQPLVTRLATVDLRDGAARILSQGPFSDRLPRASLNGESVVFLSDRREAENFQLYLLDTKTLRVRAAPDVDGWVECCQWAPNGRLVLLAVTGHGADTAGGQGSISSKQRRDKPSWMPEIRTGNEKWRWRKLSIYDTTVDSMMPVEIPALNVWEAAWCGSKRVVAVTSPSPDEGAWYRAHLSLIELATLKVTELYRPKDQIGVVAANPSGTRVAFVEAVCSDRGVVGGELRLMSGATKALSTIDTRGIDVTSIAWCSDVLLLVAGHRGLQTVIGMCEAQSGQFRETWRSEEISSGARYATVSRLGSVGDCALIGESFVRAPEIAVVRDGIYSPVRSFDAGYENEARVIHAVQRVTWKAEDELEIEGLLLSPRGAAPHPLVMCIHGGPVGLWRTGWLGRRSPHLLMLVARGFAIFFPNPRGSAGRGRDFAGKVVGDPGGADAKDLLTGIDALVARGSADPARLGVMGASYGGFMTSWLVTQDRRFAAAVSISPHTNQVTEHLLSNIPTFVSQFFGGSYTDLSSKYYTRSPVLYANQVRTPVLNICGALDRCTPPEEAAQFHNALLEGGTRSVLAIYPEEGHGVRRSPAVIDYAARVVAWFEEHLPAQPGRTEHTAPGPRA